MRSLSMSAALREALQQILRDDADAFLIGASCGWIGTQERRASQNRLDRWLPRNAQNLGAIGARCFGIQILDCPLPPQHMSAAMSVFHPSHSRDYYCTSRAELIRMSGPRWVWRWLPRFEKFAVIERRTNRLD